MNKQFWIYPITIGIFALFIWLVINKGNTLRPSTLPPGDSTYMAAPRKAIPLNIESKETVFHQFTHNIQSPLGILLLQIITILCISKVFGRIAIRFGQPSVVGEMIGGIFLGPSCVGLLLPEFSNFLFSKSSLLNLQYFSSLGIAFFMFIIGMELDISKLKSKAQSAILISHVSIIFPFFLGVSVSYFIYERFAPYDVSFLSFALFMGIAMSITAFPVLARILQERQLTKTPMGAMVLTCAAADDVTAWCILAAVVAIVKAGSFASALFTISLAFIFVLLMLYVIRPQIRKLYERYEDSETMNKTVVIIVFFTLLSSAYIAEVIGIHALFGAFLAGVIMPQQLRFKELFVVKIEDVSILLLLPIFFALTGLRTEIGLLNEGRLWIVFALILFIAVLGKFAGSAITARFVGNSWSDSFAIGALMNTRGLMQLIVLNMGYDLGILSRTIFAIMVLMALTTTFMTGPSLDIIEYFKKKKSAVT